VSRGERRHLVAALLLAVVMMVGVIVTVSTDSDVVMGVASIVWGTAMVAAAVVLITTPRR